MKYFSTLLFVFLAIQLAWSQSNVPQSFSYQAVARDNNGVCLSQENLTVRLTILDGPGGSIQYRERHNVQTNSVGHFQVSAGDGSDKIGSFLPENWLVDPYLRVELAPGFNQTAGFSLVGEIPLLSVPFSSVSDIALNGKLTISSGAEYLNFIGNNRQTNVQINGDDHGKITVHDPLGDPKVNLRTDPTISGAGVIQVNGPNTNNIELSVFSPNCPDNGAIGIRDVNGNLKAQLYVDCNGIGTVAVNGVKPFFMDHPTQPNQEIWYCAIEGPEAGAYERGTATLVNGEAEINFPEHFQIVANPSTMTITTSPWSAESKGIAVIERTKTGFKVKELFEGTGTYKFDWRVEAKRKGYENFQVIRETRKDTFNYQGQENE